MLTVINAGADKPLAERIKADLQKVGYTVQEAVSERREDMLIAVISPAGSSDAGVQAALIQALDSGQHIIPVIASPTALPKLIDHLAALDFSQGYHFAALKGRIEALSTAEAGRPMTVLTPRTREKNRNIGYWLAALALVWFILGVILVGVFGIQAPQEEYNTLATQVGATVNAYVERNLPHTTQEAANFPATVQAAPTAQRPLLIATATARAAEIDGQ
ncbi:MAG: toll/interleukin-1 receptor domain-containing protein [Anaerolineae bacterium]|nr:toll/interleukin-1 receptor domain-containing protein [Anaerolineae bacterium]